MLTRRGLLKIAAAGGLALAAAPTGALAAPARSTPGRPSWQAALDEITATTAIGALAQVHDRTRVLPGGTRLWGHGGDFLDGYYTESWTTENGDRRLTVAATPWGQANVKIPITDLLRTVFEG